MNTLIPRSLRLTQRPSPRLVVLSLLALLAAGRAGGQTSEFRGWFADAWGANFATAAESTQLIADARAGHFNAIVPQARRRGDAFYNSHYEPKSVGLSASYDPLGDLVAKAHNTNNGPYIEVHAWLVTFHIWKGFTKPADPTHPLNLHPDWLLLDVTGTNFIGGEYTFDPGHPEVQKHTYNVCMDIITNYNVDGLNFDYIRYSSTSEGYNPVSVARFNQLFGRTGQPSAVDAAWKQFRRDQVTGLLRKVYLNAIAVRPNVKISCDTITWSPGPADDSAWYNSSGAWNSVLQDWRGWMEEGIMDLNLPMAYFDQAGAYTLAWTNWCNFTRDHHFNRHAAINAGTYLNSAANALIQLRYTRQPSPGGNYADGVCSYDYGTPPSGLTRATYTSALVNPSAYDPIAPAIFSDVVASKPMPWKTAPTKGHLKGVVYGGSLTNPLDGAVVRLTGPVARTQTNDATGFYGFVDLAPGTYTVWASSPGYPNQTNTLSVTAGAVATQDILLSAGGPPLITSQPQSLTVAQGSNATFNVSLNGTVPFDYQWRFNGTNLAGATQSSFTRTNAGPTDAGSYSVAVTNALGNATSSNALLTVIVPPAITTQPQSQAVTQGVNVTFSVAATGTAPLGYFWRFNGAYLSGATASTYTRLNAQPADAGTYSVVVSNSAGNLTSSNATLTVSQAPVPPSISQPPADLAVFAHQMATFTVAANGATPLAYQWRFNGANLTGATTTQLPFNDVLTNQAGGYSVVVTNAFGSITSRVAVLTVNPVFVAAGLSKLWSLAPGSRPYLTIAALANERGLAYDPTTRRLVLVSRTAPSVYVLDAESGADLWPLSTSGISGGTYTLLMVGVADDGAVYAGNLTTAGPTTAFKLYRWPSTSSNAVPAVAFSGDPSPGINQRWGDTLDVRGAGTNTQVILGSRSGTNVAILTTADGTTFTSKSISVADAPAGSFGLGIAFGVSNTFWGKANGSALRQVAFDRAAGTGSTLRVHADPAVPNAVAPIGVSTPLNLLAGINVGVTNNHLRLYDLTPASGTPAFIGATNFPADNDNSGTGTGSVDFGGDRVYALCANNGILALQIVPQVTPAGIAAPPQSQSVKAGSDATFTVAATGTLPLSYQWSFLGSGIPGATGSSYTRLNVQPADAGNYSVTVTNVAGGTNSTPAALTVLLPQPAHFEGVTALPDGRMGLRWIGDPDWPCLVEASTNLGPSNWVLLGPVTGSNGVFEFVDDFATNASRRFYRTRQ